MPQYVLKQMINNVYPVSNIQKIYKFKNYAFIHLNNREDAEELFNELTGKNILLVIELVSVLFVFRIL